MKMDAIGARPDVTQLLAQMRALKEAAHGQQIGAKLETGTVQPGAAPAAEFGQHLSRALKAVNTEQVTAARLADGLGRDHNDLVSVMVQSQKASVAFQAASQVRNRLVSAYETIMNMPI